jgi:hypothetical protein
MKKLILGIAFSVFTFALMAAPSFAVTPNWSTTGTWNFDLNSTVWGGIYSKTMVIAQDSSGNITGNGSNVPAGNTWNVVGNVSGNTVNFSLTYDVPMAGYVATFTGNIQSDGLMNGTWSDVQYADSGLWHSTSGAATEIVAPTLTITPIPALIGPPTNKDQCKRDGWKTFNNPLFKNQGQCIKYVKDHKEDGRVYGDLKMSTPSQKIIFNLSEKDTSDFRFHHKNKMNKVEYWNYDYPGGLHYKADVLCVDVDKSTKEARFMFQIPDGWPGLTGLYVVSYVKDVEKKGVVSLYGHSATSDLATATAWCETGVGFSPAMYPVIKGKVEVK